MSENENWEDIRPGRAAHMYLPSVSMRVSVSGRNNSAQTYIGINSRLAQMLGWEIGDGTLITAQYGSGPNAGRIRLRPDTSGHYRVQLSGSSKRGRNGARVSLSIPGQPQQAVEPVLAGHKVVGDMLFIDLPEAWRGSDVGGAVPAEQAPVPTVAAEVEPAPAAPAAPAAPGPKVKPVPDVPALSTGRAKQLNPAMADLAARYVDHGVTLTGRFLTLKGQGAPLTLQSDEVALIKELLARFGETVVNGALNRLGRVEALVRVQKRLVGSRLALMQKSNGWALVWADDARYFAGGA